MNFINPLHRHAVERPDGIAIITPQGTISWSRLDDLLWSAALDLHALGIRQGDRVGILMQHPMTHLVASLALARIGAAHACLHANDASRSALSVKEKLSLTTVLCDTESLRNTFPDAQFFGRLTARRIDTAEKNRLAAEDPDLPWLILQSSGTTGLPKFAELSHRAAKARAERYLALFGCGPSDIFWPASRLDFVLPKQRTMHALLAGAAVCLPVGLPLSGALVEFLNKTGITLACGSPSHMHQLIEIGKAIPCLRAFEARSATIHESLRKAFRAQVNPNLHVVYGTNEGDALAIADPGLQDAVPNTVGRPAGSIELEVVDENGAALLAGQVGQIRVSGPGIVASYLGNPEASAKSFKDGWFHPGDMGYLSREGAVVLAGRADDMMIFDGMNIYPAEIENALSSHPCVIDAAAFPLKHRRYQDIPVAAVTLRQSVSEQELVAHCKALVGIKHPQRVFVLKKFPRNPMGKILKRELPELILRNASETKNASSATPRTSGD